MRLVDALERLSTGELSNLALSSDGSGGIKPSKLNSVISALNEGLTRLYTKLELKQENVFINPKENINTYVLDSRHALSNPNFPNDDKYLQDTVEKPFRDDVIKILDVVNSTGFSYPINNPTKELSIFTPSYNTIQFPYPIAEIYLSITYQAKHPRLVAENVCDQELEIPPSLEGALFSYVAYVMYSNLNTQEAVANAQKYLQNYQLVLNDVIEQDSINQTYAQDNIKFHKRGFI